MTLYAVLWLLSIGALAGMLAWEALHYRRLWLARELLRACKAKSDACALGGKTETDARQLIEAMRRREAKR